MVPDDVNHSEAVAWRRAARGLALAGEVRAIYLRRDDRAGRWHRHLPVTSPDSQVLSDVFHRTIPAWVAIAPPILTSFTQREHALDHRTRDR